MDRTRLPLATIAAGFLLAAPMTYAESKAAETTRPHRPAKHVKSDKRVVPQDKGAGDSTIAADNTGSNKRDRAETEVTADEQNNNTTDLAMTAEIRRAIMRDEKLSTNAHNVKIIVQNGNVTLKGPVRSKSERAAVEKAALEAIGPGKETITNELSVAP